MCEGRLAAVGPRARKPAKTLDCLPEQTASNNVTRPCDNMSSGHPETPTAAG